MELLQGTENIFCSEIPSKLAQITQTIDTAWSEQKAWLHSYCNSPSQSHFLANYFLHNHTMISNFPIP